MKPEESTEMNTSESKKIDDYDLSPEQLWAIIPIIHEKMNSRMSEKKFNEKCIAAMKEAGRPLEDRK